MTRSTLGSLYHDGALARLGFIRILVLGRHQVIGVAFRATIVTLESLTSIVIPGLRTDAEVVFMDRNVVAAARRTHHATADDAGERQSSSTRRKIGRASAGARK